MADVVVTVPKWFGLDTWIKEGDPVGVPWSGEEWHFYFGGAKPDIAPGERVYVVFNNAVRGYAPLVRLEYQSFAKRGALVRHGGAVAVTIPAPVRGFQGWRYRWWETAIEQPFPEWQNPNASGGGLVSVHHSSVGRRGTQSSGSDVDLDESGTPATPSTVSRSSGAREASE